MGNGIFSPLVEGKKSETPLSTHDNAHSESFFQKYFLHLQLIDGETRGVTLINKRSEAGRESTYLK